MQLEEVWLDDAWYCPDGQAAQERSRCPPHSVETLVPAVQDVLHDEHELAPVDP